MPCTKIPSVLFTPGCTRNFELQCSWKQLTKGLLQKPSLKCSFQSPTTGILQLVAQVLDGGPRSKGTIFVFKDRGGSNQCGSSIKSARSSRSAVSGVCHRGFHKTSPTSPRTSLWINFCTSRAAPAQGPWSSQCEDDRKRLDRQAQAFVDLLCLRVQLRCFHLYPHDHHSSANFQGHVRTDGCTLSVTICKQGWSGHVSPVAHGSKDRSKVLVFIWVRLFAVHRRCFVAGSLAGFTLAIWSQEFKTLRL